jgi:hypothetical protein
VASGDVTQAADGQPQLAGRSANIYVDGFNLYYGCLKDTSYRWLDIAALCQKLVPQNPINQVHYFTAKIRARPGDPDAPRRQATYLRALEATGSLRIHLGHFQSSRARLPLADPPADGGPRTALVVKTEEKGSDVNLATWLLLDAFKRSSDIAVVLSNDSDLEAPIRAMIEDLNVPVGLVNPHRAKSRSRDLLKLKPLFFKQIRPSALEACQLPAVLYDDRGEIRRPGTW